MREQKSIAANRSSPAHRPEESADGDEGSMEKRREPGGLVANEARVEETDRENPRLAKSGSGEGVGGEESGGQSHLPGGRRDLSAADHNRVE